MDADLMVEAGDAVERVAESWRSPIPCGVEYEERGAIVAVCFPLGRLDRDVQSAGAVDVMAHPDHVWVVIAREHVLHGNNGGCGGEQACIELRQVSGQERRMVFHR